MTHHPETTVINDRFGLRGYVKFSNGSAFFDPAAAHKAMVGSVVGKLTVGQIAAAKALFAEKAGIARTDVL